jgi:hypothetical protein
MDTNKAQNLINEIFSGIESAANCQEIQALLNHQDIPDSCKMDLKKYPKIWYTISSEEIQNLIEKGILSKDFFLTEQATKDMDTLSKLLYAVIWKNGDLRKIKHIVQGIINTDEVIEAEGNAIVFRQFGNFLNQTGEPIIDQHVIRAFALYRAKPESFDRIRSIGILNKKHQPYVVEYKEWLKNGIRGELKSQADYTYHIDQLLFAVGKAMKKRKD